MPLSSTRTPAAAEPSAERARYGLAAVLLLASACQVHEVFLGTDRVIADGGKQSAAADGGRQHDAGGKPIDAGTLRFDAATGMRMDAGGEASFSDAGAPLDATTAGPETCVPSDCGPTLVAIEYCDGGVPRTTCDPDGQGACHWVTGRCTQVIAPPCKTDGGC